MKKNGFLIMYETEDGTSYQIAQSQDEAVGWCKREVERLQDSPFGPFFAPQVIDDWLSDPLGHSLASKYGSISIAPVPFI